MNNINFIPEGFQLISSNKDTCIIETANLDIEHEPHSIISDNTTKFITELKTYDSSLKVICASFKLLGLKEEYEIVKEMRRVVKDILSIKMIKNGELNFDISNLDNPRQRKAIASSLFSCVSLAANTKHYALAFAPESLQESITDTVLETFDILNMAVSPLKLAYKLSSFDVALRDRLNFEGSSEELKLKNITLIKSGIEVGRELVKTGVLLTGVAYPAIPVGLAITGAVSGSMGLYLGYTTCHAENKKAQNTSESIV